jgi:protein gp37
VKDTKIEWAHHTFNPWIGCTKVSPACDHCYAENLMGSRMHVVQWGAGQPRKRTSARNWNDPRRWNAEAERLGVRYRVFCASLADVFDNEVPQDWRADLFALIHATPHLDWLLLTKRIGNAWPMIAEGCCGTSERTRDPIAPWPWPNVWLGATICNQAEADRDIPKLLATPARVRFLSMEPLLGPVDLGLCDCDHGSRPGPGGVGGVACANCGGFGGRLADWVIVGGESGPQARPMHPDWARSLRDQCTAAGVPFLFKQWGEWVPLDGMDSELRIRTEGNPWCRMEGTRGVVRVGKKRAGRMLDGRTWDEVPG